MFGIYKLNVSDYFTARNNKILLRGHEHCISVPRYSKSVQRRNFIIDRICNVWNNLPVESTSFASVHAFNNYITSTHLIGYFRVNFRYFLVFKHLVLFFKCSFFACRVKV